jgi:hypothetical protein
MADPGGGTVKVARVKLALNLDYGELGADGNDSGAGG